MAEQEKGPAFLADFPEVATAEWEEKIHEDLKGADYQKRLIWNPPDGIVAMPYYREEHLAHLSFLEGLPGQAPLVRGNKTRTNSWDIRQDIDEEDIEKANFAAIQAIEGGVEAVGLHMGAIHDSEGLKSLLSGIDTARVALHLHHAKDYLSLLGVVRGVLGDNMQRGLIHFDPLGTLLVEGLPAQRLDETMEQAAAMIRSAAALSDGFGLIAVSGQLTHNAGAGVVQELAFMLSHGNEYLSRLTDKGVEVDEVAKRMHFRLAVGSSYFLEIAKIRAVRMLWSNIVAQYHPTKEESKRMIIHAESAMWNKTVYDPYVNLLRTSTEAMSAAIAGVDSLLLHPFDATFRPSNAFSSRLARNQQIVLRSESYFDKVVDPSAGSYYIENLTDLIARAAWKLFQEVEEKGGFTVVASSGFITEEIEKTCQQRHQNIGMRRQVFVGTNQYPNAEERMLEKLQRETERGAVGVLKPHRGVQAFEDLRLAVEQHEKKGFDTPRVFLLTFGNLAMRKARASFSANFFGISGYKVREGSGYADVSQGLKEALEADAHVIVVCSSDDEYAMATQTITAIKHHSPETLVVVAGNPTALAAPLNQAGVDHYIHLRSNALETLKWFNEKLLSGGTRP